MSWFVLASLIGFVIGYPVMAEFIARREELAWRDSGRNQPKDARNRYSPPNRPSAISVEVDPVDCRWKGWRAMTVSGLVDESPDCRSFLLRPLDGLGLPGFLGGQFITVRVQDPVTGKQLSRCYSLSSGPSEPHYRITVKRVPGGAVSNLLHDRIRVGDVVEIQAPAGRFHLASENQDRPLVLIAAGIGITPMLSMLMNSLEVSPTRPIELFYQLRDDGNAPFLGLLRRIHAKLADNESTAAQKLFGLHVWFSQPDPQAVSPRDRCGRINAAGLLDQLKTRDADFRICGPNVFMTDLAAGLVDGGVAPDRVQFESFGGKIKGVGAIKVGGEEHGDENHAEGTEDRPAKSSATVEVTFQSTGKKSVWDGTQESLLDFAEQQGVPVESSCRSGNCGECVKRLIRGRVRYDQEPSCEIEADEVVMCVAQPESDVCVDA